MATTELECEFYSKTDLDEKLRAKAKERFRRLAENYPDLTGASITVEELANSTTPYRYQAHVVVRMRPRNFVLLKRRETAEKALEYALDEVEHCVREYQATPKPS